ncbi:dienelactone hydrolase [Caulobacter sp. Root655]|uniref:alpha/beta hydrolase family protein n=1 Tax=Caulobacter sp. Root655 TaxID=1736578 RepID=UPI0006F725C3|nr:prolyl oligopeptidase family serine peptidase [Caulobacter sp. Root655]KRA64773.1 dienelactone hydrolase [Caulobacter sp. Root655]
MSIRSLLLAPLAALALASPALAANAGFTVVQVPDPRGPPITVGVWYPTDAPAAPMTLGIGAQTVARGAPLVGDHLPLVVMSHGNGGFFGGHADTAQALAQAGFVVAALTHVGDNYQDQSRATDMANRPRQLSLLIDYMLTAAPMKAAIDPDRVGAFGFSSGGFTVLVAAGATPDLTKVAPHCQAHPDYFDCKLTKDRPPPADALSATWVHDARIRAVVSAAPAMGYTLDVSRVTLPLQLWRAADDKILPDPDYATAVRAHLPKAPDYHLVAKAGHFDFLTPCNDANQVSAAFICSSAPGFDRAAFHRDFDAKVVGFFTRELAP